MLVSVVKSHLDLRKVESYWMTFNVECPSLWYWLLFLLSIVSECTITSRSESTRLATSLDDGVERCSDPGVLVSLKLANDVINDTLLGYLEVIVI